jgi:hypothetical protein
MKEFHSKLRERERERERKQINIQFINKISKIDTLKKHTIPKTIVFFSIKYTTSEKVFFFYK